MITVFGAANWDIFFPVADLPARDTALFLDKHHSAPGGKGVNQAIAAKMAGSDVQFYGAMGQDSFAQDFLKAFDYYGVDASGVELLSGHNTGLASIFVDHTDGTHKVVVSLGANLFARESSVPDVSIGANSILVTQGEALIEETMKLVRRAKENGATTMLNFAPAKQNLTPSFMHDLDYIILNEYEADAVGRQFNIPSQSKIEFANTLSKTFNVHSIVTLGPDGAVYAGSDGVMRLPALPIKPVDTIGAGDALVGFFASAIDRKIPIEEALRHGIVAGSLACTKYGAQTGLPTQDEVLRRLPEVHVQRLG
jgi:ribokinase